MATPVLATKLFIPPPRAPAVSRARLIQRLEVGREAGRKLTLASAPAGFGKTTLLSEWIAHIRLEQPATRIAWLSLDDADNDLTRFLGYLLAAVHGAHSGAAPQPPAGQAAELTMTTLINELAQASSPVVLVLDDFQCIEAAPVRDALVFLLDHLPPNLHVVIASRSDPILPLARMRGRDELTEFRAADLRFTAGEASRFLNHVMGLELSADEVAALETRTEGWIAGLQLAALSMRERSDVAGFIEAFTGSNRFVIDYLGEEVLNRQPEHLRGFLLGTSHLERLSGPLCDAVTGRTDSTELLATLERDNLFLVPLDDHREWYRYHHLFADVLRARSLRENREAAALLHLLASQWHEANDLPDDAIRHALAATDFPRAAALVERAMPELRRGRQDSTLLGWLAALPRETARRMPVLSVYYAWSFLISGDLDAVEARLRDAEAALAAADHGSAAGEELESLPVTIAIYRAAAAQARGDRAATRGYARLALELTGTGDHLGRGSAAGFLALTLWGDGEVEAAVRTFADARESLRLAGNTADLLSSAVVMADMLLVLGRRGEAREVYEHALRLASAQADAALLSRGDLYVGLSEFSLDEGDRDAALAHLETSTALGPSASVPESRYRWFVAMARVRAADGDVEAALGLLSEAERLYVPGFLPEVRPLPAMKARLWIGQGRLPEAQAWADRRGLSPSDDVTYLSEFDHITLARLLIAQQNSGAAVELLQRLLESANAEGRMGSATEILAVQALAHHAHGLRTAFAPVEGEQSMFETLSERELHVLRLLTTELSGPQIASELFVSLNTFRTHTKHIFAKLGVNSRPTAVRRARTLGLL